MKLLFVISKFGGGGAEGVMCTLSNEFAERGHMVTLVSHFDNPVYVLNDKVNKIDYKTWQYDTSQGCLPVRLWKKIVNRFRDYSNLKRIIKEKQPDVVMSFLMWWLWQLILLCKYRIPLVFCDRNAYVRPVGNTFLNKRVFFKMADVVQVMSHHDVAYLRNRYKKTVAMPNPLRFAPLSQENYKNSFKNRRNIIACGRIEPQKGYDKLIQAFAIVAEQHPSWDVDIYGQGKPGSNYPQELQELVTKLNLSERVRFMGYQKDLNTALKDHSIFCLSSAFEGFPNVLSEAMAMGCACVSFDIVTGPREIIVDGLDGMIVDDQDINALAEGLDLLMANEDVRYKFGLHAIENIKRFSKDRVVDKWEQVLEKLIIDYKANK